MCVLMPKGGSKSASKAPKTIQPWKLAHAKKSTPLMVDLDRRREKVCRSRIVQHKTLKMSRVQDRDIYNINVHDVGTARQQGLPEQKPTSASALRADI